MNNHLFTSTLLKSFDILDCFQDDRQETGIKEIASHIDMPQSSVCRIIQSLEFMGLLFQNKENKKYRLGPKFISLARRHNCLNEYQRAVVRHMDALSRETGETVNLGILDCDKIIYIHRVECQHVLRPNFQLNGSYYAHRTGLGMVLLAELSDAGLRWVYERNADDIGKPYNAFVEEIRKIRKDGFALDDQVFCSGLRCAAAPVAGPGGRAMFSISVSAPVVRMEDEVYQNVRRQVVKYAAAASEEILGMD